MIQKSDRRILRFPAIQPCEGISPATLVESLSSLARSICGYQSKNFATQKRNSREAIRQIGILLFFFEEIRETRPVLSDSVVLCFLELHVAFQKIWYLLEDCTREGARLWILMKFRRVSTEFRTLIRTLATALDVLPLSSIDVSPEVKELGELVAKQSRTARFDAEIEDERAANVVMSILHQFAERASPNLAVLEGVLEYLGIKSWNECNRELKFLNEVIDMESSTNESERDIMLLRSLIGLISYCRGVMFDLDVSENSQRFDDRSQEEDLSSLNPEDFRCPISLEIMTDPVTIATGQTYDRSSILKWFKAGNLTCPKTGEKLTTTEMVPNSSLQKLIQQYCSSSGFPIVKQSSNRARDITKTISAGSPAAAEAIRMVARFLADKLAHGAGPDRNKAAYEIRLLAKSNIFNRSCLVSAGAIPFLLNLLSSMDPTTQENAIAAVLNLSKHPQSKSVIVENGGLILILDVLKDGLKVESRQTAAATLFYLASVEDYRKVIGEIPETMPTLVQLIRDGTPRGKKNAVVTILELLLFPGNHGKVLEAGTVPLLVQLLRCCPNRTDLVTDSIAVLARLAENPDGAAAILRSSGLSLLMEMIQSESSKTTKEYCASALLSLCISGGREVVSFLQKSASLMDSLYALMTHGSCRASKKASLILGILHEFQSQSSSSGLSSNRGGVTQDQIVHVR